MQVLGKLYKATQEHLIATKVWVAGCKLGTTGPKGCLWFAAADDDVKVLYTVKVNDQNPDEINIEAHVEELSKLAINEADAKELIEDASAFGQ